MKLIWDKSGTSVLRPSSFAPQYLSFAASLRHSGSPAVSGRPWLFPALRQTISHHSPPPSTLCHSVTSTLRSGKPVLTASFRPFPTLSLRHSGDPDHWAPLPPFHLERSRPLILRHLTPHHSHPLVPRSGTQDLKCWTHPQELYMCFRRRRAAL